MTHWFDRGGGQVVNTLAFFSYDLSLNPVEVYNSSVQIAVGKTKIKKRPGLAD